MDTLWRNKRRDDKKRFFRALRNKREKTGITVPGTLLKAGIISFKNNLRSKTLRYPFQVACIAWVLLPKLSVAE
ncbi:hypothetical protein [Akkermansia sp.]|uniref:hypothetical protein n=1 Tax=Akkermansia sp. TaxID=1872421 RepID=UPI0011AF79D0